MACARYHEPHGVSSNEVVCHATELVPCRLAAVPIAPWGLTRPLAQFRDALDALEGNKLLEQRSSQWPAGRLVPGW